ncbi:hypothetical protein CFOL_v3_22449 [Cephalotus follicularis]|uniref:Uncharacterized protein n=1 Tax=Cephalotus follicularis TaxID=3775 RepID=A0A1Q3CFG7_CEPFO|nr:hypothetical protein CFOL_v3_22449 [Cephalotus follicularis]
MQVFLMWCILSKIEFCFPLLMLKTMVRAFSQKKSVLPFGSILTKVFLHHQIRLEGEIATKLKKEDTYNKSTMNRMGWKKQEGIWTYCPKIDQGPRMAREEQEDNTPWEAHDESAPAQPQAQGTSSSADLDRIMELMRSSFDSMQPSLVEKFEHVNTRLTSLEKDHEMIRSDFENIDETIYYDLKVVKRRLKRMERKLADSKTIDGCEETSGVESDSDAPPAAA